MIKPKMWRAPSAVVLAFISLFLLTPVSYAAQTSTSQGYITKAAVSDGAIVSLEANNYQTVEMATTSNRNLLVGVAVKANQALVSFADGTSQVQVVTTGTTTLQVSTANGPIKTGDRLSPSPISGVAMKATTAGKVVGVAQQDFTADAATDKTSIELTDNNGQKQTALVGKIGALIGVEDWSPNGQPNSPLLNGLRSFLGSAVGKPVSNVQALFAVAIILLAVLGSATILYSAVSSSIHSIGRNPLSRGIIRRSLFIMLGLSIIVVVGAGSAVYLILGG